MVRIYRFAAVRPERTLGPGVPSVPYDVVTAEEARDCIQSNPVSFLRVIRPDAEMPGAAPDDERVYLRARDVFLSMQREGILVRDPAPGFYLYRIVQDGMEFVGLVCCVSTRDYTDRRIRRHELTRYDKEEDRTRHIDAVNAHTGLVFLLYRDPGGIYRTIHSLARNAEPDGEMLTERGVLHQIFRIEDASALSRLEELFGGVSELYIADGHHRAKSAVNVAERRRLSGRPSAEAERFMAVLFAHDRVRIHGYSRLVADLGGYSPEAFLEELSRRYDVRPYGRIDGSGYRIVPKKRTEALLHIIHMYLRGRWYEISCPVRDPEDPIASLDVTVLQKEVLEGMLGISDPRGDTRLHYLGGARPLSDLEKMVDGGKYAAAFAMQPVGIETVLAIADNDGVMPPKSTWFEPKLLSGLVVHTLDER
ncbi:MAG: DUF1015 family protein [Methanomicrobiaceae archaeon]|uniref:DUF1015 domain-containing protein n=1 Tax=hydrocarbon metagenome TaxID=938273 RepID=A0A0W8FKF3_9ZZZZ|nr:DUF1015 family protein [Methanomicrobiaceae archaeon]MDD5418237.1 DUF1015 family protein [Methanomicrobiaceae archaeon]